MNVYNGLKTTNSYDKVCTSTFNPNLCLTFDHLIDLPVPHSLSTTNLLINSIPIVIRLPYRSHSLFKYLLVYLFKYLCI